MNKINGRIHAGVILIGLILAVWPPAYRAQKPEEAAIAGHGERMLVAYFKQQVKEIAPQGWEGLGTLADWIARREPLRRQLYEMIGLWPLPARSALQATVTGRLELGELIVEKVHYQSAPGLYVTANLYRPKEIKAPLPAVLYLCGHGNIKKGGVSYGSKAQYQHHPAWFARHGFVALVLDTLQLGEIEGLHHGTNREGLWWWVARGYTPAGVETWNAMRALDYLQTRPEVDATRIGVTGRSGGGAYSWYLAALDDRVQAAVPVAGITDLQNHVVDGAIEGHCDCMYMVNTYRWDFPLLAALVAPRPLLLANSDKDKIFPLDGVLRIHEKVRQVYRLYGAEDRLGLLITEGPHRDTQDLQVPAFRWMSRWLQKGELLIEKPAIKLFEPEPLKVFEKLPDHQRNTRIHESFVPAAADPPAPAHHAAWVQLRQDWLQALRQNSFAGWPPLANDPLIRKVHEVTSQGLRLSVYDFTSQPGVSLRLWILDDPKNQSPQRVVLKILDQSDWAMWLSELAGGFAGGLQEIVGPGWEATSAVSPNTQRWETLRRRVLQDQLALAMMAPRGIGPTAWPAKKDTHIRRRFVLIGQTLDGMQVWDVRRALAGLRELPPLSHRPWRLEGRGVMAAIALYAALFEPDIQQLDLWNPPTSHRQGPIFLNVLRTIDMPQALALALPHCKVVVYNSDSRSWEWPRALARNLKLESTALQFRQSDE